MKSASDRVVVMNHLFILIISHMLHVSHIYMLIDRFNMYICINLIHLAYHYLYTLLSDDSVSVGTAVIAVAAGDCDERNDDDVDNY